MPQIDVLPLSAQYLSKNQVFLMDIGWTLYLYLSVHCPQSFTQEVLGKLGTHEKIANILFVLSDQFLGLNYSK